MSKITFNKFWNEVESKRILPNTAIEELPNALSERTKKKLLEVDFNKAVSSIVESIDDINHGSIENIDSILRRKISLK